MEQQQTTQSERMAQMEAIIFAAGEPVGVEQICKGLDLTRVEVDLVMEKLMQSYETQQRGIRIIKLDSSYQMCSAPQFASSIRSILETRPSPKLSQPVLEVLAVIAYHQPTTRTYVDQVRGVDSAYSVGLLEDRGLIEVCGKLNDVPGRPLLYRTTKNFLLSFNMNSLKDLPELGQAEPENVQLSIEQRLNELQQEEDSDRTEVEPSPLETSEDKVAEPEPVEFNPTASLTTPLEESDTPPKNLTQESTENTEESEEIPSDSEQELPTS